MKLRNKIVSGLTAMALVLTTFSATALAATDAYENGSYTATVHMYKEADPTTTSMCDPIFDHDAEVTLTDDSTIITIYVAYPIPAYPSQGTDGTLLNVSATYNDVVYTADIDTTSLPERAIDETSALFGITTGESYPMEVITFTLPAAAIDEATTTDGNGLYIEAYVNSVMMSTEHFYLRLSDMTMTSSASSSTTASDATESTEQSATVTGTVEKNNSTYTVTVPEAVSLGTLSKEEDTSVAFDITVEAENFDGESVEISATAKGSLVSDSNSENTIDFTNDFGTQTATASTTLTGNIGVLATDVAAAKSGNYTGTTTFVISYFEAE